MNRRTITVMGPACIVGRSAEAGICIPESSVSKMHARLFIEDGQLFVEDLGSTNGTYVNAQKIQQSAVIDGDLVQFANALYRVGCTGAAGGEGTIEEGVSPWAQTLLVFERLISERAVVPHFQAIVSIDRQSTPAYEVLARSNLPEMSNPAAMFGAAERLGQQAVLSEMMRFEGLACAAASQYPSSQFFLNTHHAEVQGERLIESLTELRRDYPELPITIEIHEAAVTKIDGMKNLRAILKSLDMQLSYDDFGAGQGRLVELGEIPPDVLKFDMQLIRDIDKAAASRQELLRSLVRIAVELGTVPLAEGVETESEHATCQQLGFKLAQGFLYGRPVPAVTPAT